MNETAGTVNDIILATFSGHAWLVRGEQHIDDLLANTLAAHVSIGIVACESKSAVDALWRQHDGAGHDGDGSSMMWLIHPAIVNRARGGPSGEATVTFAAWSAALDDAAEATLRAVAQAAARQPECMLALVRFVAADAPAMATDLANLRSGVLEAQLAAAGVAAPRMQRETRAPAQPGQAEQIDLALRTSSL